MGQVIHALLTRPPLKHKGFLPKNSASAFPLDLHVLSTPPAFILSQDQTLKLKCLIRQDSAWLIRSVSTPTFCTGPLLVSPPLSPGSERSLWISKRISRNYWSFSASSIVLKIVWIFRVVSLFSYQGSLLAWHHMFSFFQKFLRRVSK